MNGGGERI